jgi:hypothetical protein
MDDTKPTNVVPMYIACAKWFISSQINDLHFSLLAGPDLLLQFSSTVSSRIKILGRGHSFVLEVWVQRWNSWTSVKD